LINKTHPIKAIKLLLLKAEKTLIKLNHMLCIKISIQILTYKFKKLKLLRLLLLIIHLSFLEIKTKSYNKKKKKFRIKNIHLRKIEINKDWTQFIELWKEKLLMH
jgi:hypothetical protein